MSGGPSQERSKNEKVKQPQNVIESRGPAAQTPNSLQAPLSGTDAPRESQPARPVELGGPAGLEPTRYGDWERAGRCIDF